MSGIIEITGADIIGELLRGHATLTAIVAVENIKAGRFPDGVALPALLVRTISSGERDMLSRGATVHVSERTSVTVRAVSYDQQIEVLGIVRRCCAGRFGNLSGAQRVAITGAGKGPDLAGPADSYEQAIDFRVSFDATA